MTDFMIRTSQLEMTSKITDCLMRDDPCVSSLPPPTGNSGMGSYHGRHSFDQLSHLRSCLIKQLKMEGVNSMRYPPHTSKKMGWARFLLLRQVNVCKLRRMMLVATLVSLAAFVVQVSCLILEIRSVSISLVLNRAV